MEGSLAVAVTEAEAEAGAEGAEEAGEITSRGQTIWAISKEFVAIFGFCSNLFSTECSATLV